ncbi:MAG: peptide-methionine (S)-S-oxide reductase MsrA [Pseudomonadota bacterium]
MRLSRTNIIFMGLAGFAAAASFFVTASADNEGALRSAPASGIQAEAIFAGGCFWCVESDFDKVPGVLDTISGYTGGALENPSYKQVTYENTGHYEAVKVVYDPEAVSYGELVEYFWRHVDPTDAGGQFCDRGDSYRTAIFTGGEDQAETASASKAALEASKVLPNPVVTPILEATAFWPAEGYHQDYYKKNPLRYNAYRRGCGRDARVRAVWSRANDNAPIAEAISAPG